MKKKVSKLTAAVMTALFSMTGCATTADGAATGANGATSLIMIVGYMVIIIGVYVFCCNSSSEEGAEEAVSDVI